ncbi:HPr family phosphocarrier protein [bacterium]|nr:HPr family phosphocarrier protein [bacterium]
MSNDKLSTTVTITNPQGLHMRPAYLLAETAAQFQSEIELVKDDIRVDGKSVLGILTLGAAQGTEVIVEATGEDAGDAIAKLEKLLESGFPSATAPETANDVKDG